MCQYSARDGRAGDWHFVHYPGSVGLMFVEATAVAPEGRVSLGDLGLWEDGQFEPLARIVQFARAHGCVVAVQPAHAKRKAGMGRAQEAQRSLKPKRCWQSVAPSAIAFNEGYDVPQALDEAGIREVVERFAAAARRA